MQQEKSASEFMSINQSFKTLLPRRNTRCKLQQLVVGTERTIEPGGGRIRKYGMGGAGNDRWLRRRAQGGKRREKDGRETQGDGVSV